MSELKQSIKMAALRGENFYLKLCKVDSVDADKRTVACTPYDKGAKLVDIPLQASSEKNKGFCIIPAVGSDIAVGFYDKNNAVVVLYTEIEKVLFSTNDVIEFNEGENDGLVKIRALEDNLKSLKDYVEAMNIAISTGIKSVGAAMQANGATGATAYDTAMTGKAVQFKDMENAKITH